MGEQTTAPRLRIPVSLGALAFLAAVVFLLWEEHAAHMLGALPYLLLIACPLIHIFMHGGHGHAGHGHPGHGHAGHGHEGHRHGEHDLGDRRDGHRDRADLPPSNRFTTPPTGPDDGGWS